MISQENSKRNVIANRFQFNMRNMKTRDSVSQFKAQLRKLSQY